MWLSAEWPPERPVCTLSPEEEKTGFCGARAKCVHRPVWAPWAQQLEGLCLAGFPLLWEELTLAPLASYFHLCAKKRKK